MYSSLLTVLLVTVGANASQTYEGGGYPADPGITYGESTDYGHLSCWHTFWGPEPQTCYSPRYGCYPGNNRYMHRYPAFHGYHYRRPYNYRNVFDYPWHAALHEPTSHFSYNVMDDGPAMQGAPLAPPIPAEEIHTPAVEEAPTASRGKPIPHAAQPRTAQPHLAQQRTGQPRVAQQKTIQQLSREEILRRREVRQAVKPGTLRTGPDQKRVSAAPAAPALQQVRGVQHLEPLKLAP